VRKFKYKFTRSFVRVLADRRNFPAKPADGLTTIAPSCLASRICSSRDPDGCEVEVWYELPTSVDPA
jgi:hypothetical protein